MAAETKHLPRFGKFIRGTYKPSYMHHMTALVELTVLKGSKRTHFSIR